MSKTRMSGTAVKAKTGKDWDQWFSILDKAGAKKVSHKEIAQYLYDKRGVPSWWSQMVAVAYEQERGLREKHERPDGYSVSASKTFHVPIGILYKHWSDEKLRSKWLKDKFTVRKATANKSMRITWNDNTNLEVNFYSKGAAKSQVAVQHSELASSAQVERTRSRWNAWQTCCDKNSYIYCWKDTNQAMAAVVTRKFGEEALHFLGKKVSVETSDQKVYNATLAGIDEKLDVVLDNVEGHGILKVIINGAFVKEIRLMEKPFDFKALADRLARVFPGLVKIREDVGAIIVMDKIKVTQFGVEEGSGLAADRVRSIYDEFMKETKR